MSKCFHIRSFISINIYNLPLKHIPQTINNNIVSSPFVIMSYKHHKSHKTTLDINCHKFSIITTGKHWQLIRPRSSLLTYTSSQLGHPKLRHQYWLYPMEFLHNMNGLPWAPSPNIILILWSFRESLGLTLRRKCVFVEYRQVWVLAYLCKVCKTLYL